MASRNEGSYFFPTSIHLVLIRDHRITASYDVRNSRTFCLNFPGWKLVADFRFLCVLSLNCLLVSMQPQIQSLPSCSHPSTTAPHPPLILPNSTSIPCQIPWGWGTKVKMIVYCKQIITIWTTFCHLSYSPFHGKYKLLSNSTADDKIVGRVVSAFVRVLLQLCRRWICIVAWVFTFRSLESFRHACFYVESS